MTFIRWTSLIVAALILAGCASSGAPTPGDTGRHAAPIIPGLAGDWQGQWVCNQTRKDIHLQLLDTASGGYEGRVKVQGEWRPLEVVARPGMYAHYEFISVPDAQGQRKAIGLQSLSPHQVALEDGQPAYLTVKPAGRCVAVQLVRYQPVRGLGGSYGDAQDFFAMCHAVARDWLGSAAAEQQTARDLKIRLSVALQAYRPDKALQSALINPSAFRTTFGVTPEQITSPQFARLITQLAHCARQGREQDRRAFVPTLFEARALSEFRGARRLDKWRPQASISASVSRDQLINAGHTLPTTAAALSELVATLNDQSDPNQIAHLLGKHTTSMEALPPSQLREIIEPAAQRLEALRLQRHQAASQSFDGVTIPWLKIPAVGQANVRRLSSGQAFSFDTSNMQFLTGLSVYLVYDCKLPRDAAARQALAAFVENGYRRATMGLPLTGNPANGVADFAVNRKLFDTGLKAGKKIGCQDPFAQAMAQRLALAVLSNRSDGKGGDPIFVRTCALHHSRSQCQCLANAGQAAVADIYQRRYSRALVKQITSVNLASTTAIVRECHIIRY